MVNILIRLQGSLNFGFSNPWTSSITDLLLGVYDLKQGFFLIQDVHAYYDNYHVWCLSLITINLITN